MDFKIGYRLVGTHKAHGWTREMIMRNGMGGGSFRVSEPNGANPRTVEFLSAGSWSNNPLDNRANQNTDRVILCDGEPLPEWAIGWLTAVHKRSCERARAAFQDALDDADWHQDRMNADAY